MLPQRQVLKIYFVIQGTTFDTKACMQYLRTSITDKELLIGTDIFVWFKVCLKDATDVEFLFSSLRLFQSLIVEGRKVLLFLCACKLSV